ncbi:uncharacterized protein LOC119593381 [Penaeus monodon]|uniref:uncharacterized protein LOC119593381 n=1 Tax=Penaeus monodon TaxID=6687 RepID=UPI0018A7CE7F|nr:uncharacterized protein LOC119593381 [Penaeus monodon]
MILCTVKALNYKGLDSRRSIWRELSEDEASRSGFQSLKMQYTRGGVTRTINNTVYRGRVPGFYPGVYLEEEFYVICETLSPISTISSMDCVGFTKDDKLRTLRRLTMKLNEFLQEDPSVRDYVRLMEIDGMG